MKFYPDCISYCTGLSEPHTLVIDGRNVSIVRGNRDYTVSYYKYNRQFKPFAKATDRKGESYTLFTETRSDPFRSLVAIPD